MTTPLDLSFWDEEYQRLMSDASPLMLAILFAGATGGANMLPAGLDVLIDWDVFNQYAVDFLRTWQGGTLAGVNGTTRRLTVKNIQEWIKSGEPLPNLVKRLEKIYDKARAKRIATTEVTRAYAEGNLLAWKATGGVVSGKRWYTAVDERVCPICAPLHDTIVQIDSAWSADPSGRIVEDKSGFGLLAPPSHPGCRCYLVPIVSIEGFKKNLDQVLAGIR